MRHRFGNMWTAWEAADLFLISTNSTVKRNGALVMGRGIAVQARDRFPGLDRRLGAEVRRMCGNLGAYGLLVSPDWPEAKLGLFQVKHFFGDRAQIDLIQLGTSCLASWCVQHPAAQVHLNFPGIGNGHLPKAEVWPIIESLPDTVTVWEYARD